LRFEITRHGEQNAIAVDDFSIGRDEKRAIRVAIESDAERGALGGNALLQFFKVKRAASRVDVAAIRFGADTDDIAAERSE